MIALALVRGLAFAARPTSRVLIAGGASLDSSGFSTVTNTAEIYDSASGAFTSTGNMIAARQFHTATLVNVPNNTGSATAEVLITGGADATNTPLSSAELYNPTTGSFSATGSMTYGREYQTASPLPTGEVLMAGGLSYDSATASFVVLDSAEIYDPNAGTFTMVTCGSGSTDCMSSPRYGATATVLSNGEILIAGGASDTSGGISDTADIFDPATNAFSPVTGLMTDSREFASAALLNDSTVLIAGGNDGLGLVGSAEIYDPATDSFSPASTTMSVPREQGTATLLGNGNVLEAGGSYSSNGTQTNIYQARTGTFTSGGTLSADRYAQTATLLSNGSVLIAGGFSSGGTPQNTADLANARGTRISATGLMNEPRAGQTATPLP